MESALEYPDSPAIVVLAGPTASGKTALSLALARRFAGEIVSCDSVAVYRGLEIGAAKPTAAERSEIPHHLLDVATPDMLYTAGDYSRDARTALSAITLRGKLPVVAGGSGLYMRALLAGLFAGPGRSEEMRDRLRARARERGLRYVHGLLRRVDPISAARIHANDLPKVIRAIEISLSGGGRMSEVLRAAGDPLTGYRILRLGLDPDRGQLYARIDARARKMFEDGLLQETAALLSRYDGDGVPPPLNSLGYRQAAQVLRGRMALEPAIASASQRHRNYAKRQMTWFRREPEIAWLRGFGGDLATQVKAAEMVGDFLRHRSEGADENPEQ